MYALEDTLAWTRTHARTCTHNTSEELFPQQKKKDAKSADYLFGPHRNNRREPAALPKLLLLLLQGAARQLNLNIHALQLTNK